jgi:prepilin-type processing-associated H-X9-DG protein
LNRAKGAAKSAACKSNLRQIGIGLSLYLADFEKYPLLNEGQFFKTAEGMWRPEVSWDERLLPYIGRETNVFTDEPLYNDSGASIRERDADYERRSLGLGYTARSGGPLGQERLVPVLVSESQVLVPSGMLALGELVGFGPPGWIHVGPLPRFHGRQYNALLCDGHVESSDPYLIPHTVLTNYYFSLSFKSTEAQVKRWNNDNQPHPETWHKP